MISSMDEITVFFFVLKKRKFYLPAEISQMWQ